MSGVLPIIFAQSIAMIIPTVAAFLPAPEKGTFGYALVNAVDSKSVLYMIVYFLMIIAFSYFYATIQFNPVEISNNLKKNGGFIPGFRPGQAYRRLHQEGAQQGHAVRRHLSGRRGDPAPADRQRS